MLHRASKRTDELYLQGGKFYVAFRNADGSFDDYQYLGMTPSAGISIKTETLSHEQTEEAPFTTDQEIVTKIEGELKTAIDQISDGVLAMFFLAEETPAAQTAGSLDLTIAVKPGYSYMLGKLALSGVSVTSEDGQTTYAEGADYEIDSEAGLLTIKLDGTIPAGNVKVTGSYGDATYSVVEGMVKKTIEAKLRFVSDAIAGKRRVWEFHRVQIAPDGDFALKSAKDYGQAEFAIKLLQDPSITGEGISKMLKITSIAA